MRFGHTLDACMTADATHRADMELAGSTMLAVLKGELRAPQNLRWRRQTGGWGAIQSTVLARIADRDRMADIQRSFRDPCYRCGIRADVGCSHRRVA